MKKKILSLAIALSLVVGISVTAQAEDYTGSNEWLVEYNGSKIESNFASEQLADDMVNVQPGDSITFQVNLENTGKKEADWYMSNKVLKALEDSNSSAEGGAYTYILTYTDSEGKEQTIYSSELVGGEDEEEGLRKATKALEDYFYLDTMEAGGKGTVKLYVKIEGESTGTAYQETLAKLQMNFAVEKAGGKLVSSTKTGDPAQLLLYSSVLLLSGCVLLVMAVRRPKKRNSGKGV